MINNKESLYGRPMGVDGEPYNLFLTYQPDVPTFGFGKHGIGVAGSSASIYTGDRLMVVMEPRIDAEIRVLSNSAEVFDSINLCDGRVLVAYRQDGVISLKAIGYSTRDGWALSGPVTVVSAYDGAALVENVRLFKSRSADTGVICFGVFYTMNGRGVVQSWVYDNRGGHGGSIKAKKKGELVFSDQNPCNMSVSGMMCGQLFLIYQIPEENFEAYICGIDIDKMDVCWRYRLNELPMRLPKNCKDFVIEPYPRDEFTSPVWTAVPMADSEEMLLSYPVDRDDGLESTALLRIQFGRKESPCAIRKRQIGVVKLRQAFPFSSRISACSVGHRVYGADACYIGIIDRGGEQRTLYVDIMAGKENRNTERHVLLEDHLLCWEKDGIYDEPLQTVSACINDSLFAGYVTDEGLYLACHHFLLSNSKYAPFRRICDAGQYISVLPLSTRYLMVLRVDQMGALYAMRLTDDNKVLIPAPPYSDFPDAIAESDAEQGEDVAYSICMNVEPRIVIPVDRAMKEKRDQASRDVATHCFFLRKAYLAKEWQDIDEDKEDQYSNVGKAECPIDPTRKR